jgi:hypothetical protein
VLKIGQKICTFLFYSLQLVPKASVWKGRSLFYSFEAGSTICLEWRRTRKHATVSQAAVAAAESLTPPSGIIYWAVWPKPDALFSLAAVLLCCCTLLFNKVIAEKIPACSCL